ncbi:mandelate racemase/muconate lactonizing enzyme family protein [Caldalkalibacillus mannanilyticus]|uniref:mandelate racemase/muconate lactonizing enzyme family protein n=1 Tax=Caldalkalibacillus mannanilyticus TaxID=1418 RepID=UPI0004692295|nr:mandelate racemase/muconate lactonizing enzyme family protein [Caldalkalibacillus mannanilyticus]
MNITRIETYPLYAPLTQPYGDANGYKNYRTSFMFRIITESGLEGWGEVVDWLPTLDKGFRERIIPFLLGRDATNHLKLVNTIKKWNQRIAAGVSMALTEILARKAQLSVCDLWGGSYRNAVPIYASFQSYSPSDEWIKSSVQLVQEVMAEGYNKIKVKIGGKTEKEDLQHLRALFDVTEDTVGMAIDGNESYDLSTTFQWIKILESSHPILWFEEPMPMNQINDYQLLRMKSTIPIAGGENKKSVKEVLPLLQQGALDILQPDPMHLGGIEEYRHSLQLARTFGIKVSPHSFDGILSRLYAIFAQACLVPWSKMNEEDIEPIEWDVMENPFNRLIPLQPSAGKVRVPTGIGIGVSIDVELLQKYSWKGEIYH